MSTSFQERPAHITPAHWEELVVDSGISPNVAAANFRSSDNETEISQFLRIDEKIGEVGGYGQQYATRSVINLQDRYKEVVEGGWICQPIIPYRDEAGIFHEERAEWGCLKPDTPREGWKRQEALGKIKWVQSDRDVKYEHPLDTPTGIFILSNPENPHLWRRVWDEAGHPAVITEGAKKTGCLTSNGYAAVGIPGITQWNIPGTQELKPELKAITETGATFYIALDQETRKKTRQAVEREISKLGQAIRRQGCQVYVVDWNPELGKGVDDLIVAHGPEAFEKAYDKALPFEYWQLKRQSKLSFTPDWVTPEGQKYLEANELIPIPADEKLVLLKAPKGTGKTEVLTRLVDEGHQRGQRSLIIGHRIQLNAATGQRVGLLTIQEIVAGGDGRGALVTEAARNGAAITVQSLHPYGQAAFRAEDWEGCQVIIDEAEQVIWEALASSTCLKNRVPILRELKALLTDALSPESKGRVILADADLSDYVVTFVRGIADQPFLKPWLALSEFKDEGYDVHPVDSKETWLLGAEAAIERGEQIVVVTDAQKGGGRFSSSSLEGRWAKKFLNKKILRLDSETLSLRNHNAFGVMGKLNEVLTQYDIVICSPSLETGASIDIRGHFDAVYGCFHTGVLSTHSVRQSLARLRENVSRYIYVARHSAKTVGAGETWYKALAASNKKQVEVALGLIFNAGRSDIDSDFSKIATATWAKMGARINIGMAAYRDCVLQGLADEGNRVIRPKTDGDDPDGVTEEVVVLREELRNAKHDNLLAQAQATVAAPLPNQAKLEELKKTRSFRDETERASRDKGVLKARYGKVTQDIFMLDRDGWHSRIQLHYYLSIGKEHLTERDKAKVDKLLEASGDGAVWAPDITRSTLSVKIATLEYLGIPELLELEEVSAQTPQLIALREKLEGQLTNIKRALGVTINKKDGPVPAFRKIIKAIGFRLDRIRQEGGDGARVSIYSIQPVDEKVFSVGEEKITYVQNRGEIFAKWLERDKKRGVPAESIDGDGVQAKSDESITHKNSNIVFIPDHFVRESHSGRNQNLTPPLLTQTPHLPKEGGELAGSEPVYLEILKSCDHFGQYLSVLDRAGDRMHVLWGLLSAKEQARILAMADCLQAA